MILKSRRTYLTIDKVNYILFAWDTLDGKICGWLNPQEKNENYSSELLGEHKLLLRNIGGIKESFNGPEDSFSNHQNFMFIGSQCFTGIGDYYDYYSMMCEDEGKDPIDDSNLIAFAYEANGALTLYNPRTSKVLLFSHDHCFENVEFMESQPEFTFHTFKNTETFNEYAETLSGVWLNIIK